MPCFQPRRAWKRALRAKPWLGDKPPKGEECTPIFLACQQCIGCHQKRAREWAYRCNHELTRHTSAVFTTLTIADTNTHPTLSVDTAQRFLKRFRKAHSKLNGPIATLPIRHFLCGEYGTHYKRPHYHAILFGAHTATHGQLIQETWGLGLTYTVPANPQTIAYVVGYMAGKADYLQQKIQRRIHPTTGEEYDDIPSFHLMSRGGRTGLKGIGSNINQHTESFRKTVTFDGHDMPVPRYYHKLWKEANTPIDWHKLTIEKIKDYEQREKSGNYTQARIDAARIIAEHKQQQHNQRRTYA